jgi:hypothetical protein
VRTLLRITAPVEAVSLAVLLGNLLTVHAAWVGSATGPVHGAAYLMVIAAVFLDGETPRAARLSALLPGVGGLLALRVIGTLREPGHGAGQSRDVTRKARR